MSLLMQALRKAERARSQNGHEAEPETGQEQPPFGQDSVPSAPPMEGGPAFAVMPDAWRLEPLDVEPPVIPAQEAAHDPVPPQARHEPLRPLTGVNGNGNSNGTGIGAGGTGPVTGIDSGTGTATHRAESNVDGSSGVMADPGGMAAGNAGGPRLDAVGPGPGAAYAGARFEGKGRGAAMGTASAMDAGLAESTRQEPGVRSVGTRPAGLPRAIASSQRRLVILAGTLAALLTVFAFIYWRAVSGPGPGARLPMVPMPAPGSPQATQSGTVQGAAIPVTPYVSTPGDLASQGGATGASGTAAPGGPAVSSSAAGAVAGGGAAGGGAAGGGGTAGSGGPAGAGSATAAGVLAAGGYDTQAVAAPAPPTKPQAEVTIPTPEQLAAIPDPAIRAEAMRDAAERAARQARTEGLPPASSAPAPASTGSVAGMPEISINRTPHEANAPGSPPDTASAAPPRAPAAASKRPASRSSSQSAGTTVAHGGETLKTAVGQNGEVQFVRGAAAAKVAPAVQNGYAALKQGDLATARQQYDLALLQDPNNRDALLGSAAVALRLHDSKQASSSYLRLLELDPNDPDALAGLAELHPGDLQANEIKLKGLARQHPDSGPVQFALGNLFARQGRWAEAQQSYFRAFSAVPDNADYAYNLGVGLDRMNQPRLAQTYYRRALELAQASPPAFNIDTVRKRLQVLETPPQ